MPDSPITAVTDPQSDVEPSDAADFDALEQPLESDQDLTVSDGGDAGLDLRVEAALMVCDRPQSTAKLAGLLGTDQVQAVRGAVDRLNEVYAETSRSFRIEKLAGGWQIVTLPGFADTLAQVLRSNSQARLSPAAMETLAIIAYKQPILRADIEAIRGVASGEVIRGLMERRLVKIVGRAEILGRPMLYGTTRTFLESFGLATIKQLPKPDELTPEMA